METIKKHKVSIVLLITMAFAIVLYLFLIPKTTEKNKNEPTTQTEQTEQANQLSNKQYAWVMSEYAEEGQDNLTIEEPRNNSLFTIQFNNDNTFNATTDCSIIDGNYKMNNSNLIFFNNINSENQECDNSQALSFQSSLQRVESYTLNNKKLILIFGEGQGNMHFEFQTEITAIENIQIQPPAQEKETMPINNIETTPENEEINQQDNNIDTDINS